MKRDLLAYLRCLECRQSEWNLSVTFEDKREIREGSLECRFCRRVCKIEQGILNALGILPEEVAHEKEHAESFGYIITEKGEKHSINRQTITQFKDLFLKLPTGDDSHYFQPGGSFENQAGNAERFFKTLELLQLTGQERVLEVGASFGWASWRMAQRGCDVVALDVTDYLITADLYFEADGSYFDRISADMSELPFKDESFDIIFSHSVIHHCKDLSKLFHEFHRVLRPNGRVVALHECAFGIFENKSGKALQEAIHEGFNENAYTIPQWKKGAQQGGFLKVKIHMFPFIDDYIDRKEKRGIRSSSKLSAARWIRSQKLLHSSVQLLTFWPRILLRPKAWMLVATK